MNLYQQEHSVFEDHFVIEHKANFSFPVHFHRCYEFICILAGEMEVKVNEEIRILQKNDCAFIFPHQIHSLNSCESEHILFIFAPEFVELFGKYAENRNPSTNFFCINDENLINMILSLNKRDNMYKIKGVLYSICGYYKEQCAFYKKKDKNNNNSDLLKTILEYAEKNYKTKCSLQLLCDYLCYDYSYISKFFLRNTGRTFNTFINQLRINEACFMLNDKKNTILNISLECGYESVRSFNRNFLKLKGMTPTEYRLYLTEKN